MDRFDPDLISQAIVLWSNWRQHGGPKKDDEAVLTAYGPEVLTQVKELYEDFFSSDAVHAVPGLVEMGERAAAQFQDRHPEITAEAVDGLCRLYSWAWK